MNTYTHTSIENLLCCKRLPLWRDKEDRTTKTTMQQGHQKPNIPYDTNKERQEAFSENGKNFGQTNDECTTSAAQYHSAIAREYRYSNGDLGSVDGSGYSCSKSIKE